MQLFPGVSLALAFHLLGSQQQKNTNPNKPQSTAPVFWVRGSQTVCLLSTKGRQLCLGAGEVLKKETPQFLE